MPTSWVLFATRPLRVNAGAPLGSNSNCSKQIEVAGVPGAAFCRISTRLGAVCERSWSDGNLGFSASWGLERPDAGEQATPRSDDPSTRTSGAGGLADSGIESGRGIHDINAMRADIQCLHERHSAVLPRERDEPRAPALMHERVGGCVFPGAMSRTLRQCGVHAHLSAWRVSKRIVFRVTLQEFPDLLRTIRERGLRLWKWKKQRRCA